MKRIIALALSFPITACSQQSADVAENTPKCQFIMGIATDANSDEVMLADNKITTKISSCVAVINALTRGTLGKIG